MWTTMDSPVGELRLVAEGDRLTALDFLEVDAGEAPRSSTAVAAARVAERDAGERVDDAPVLREARSQLAEYFAGERLEFDLPLAPAGTPFQHRVWAELSRIPYGEVASYGRIAARLGLSGHGARAVGVANGRNPLPIVVPCHRVVAANGDLTGYGGGIARKELLLALERSAAPVLAAT